MIGKVINNYKIERQLGQGGMGVVYKALDINLHRTVALKVLHNHLTNDQVFFSRFKNEAVLLAQLNHPNITTLYNFFSEGSQSFMAMEYVEGTDLEEYLKQNNKLPLPTVLNILSSASNGLQHAHEKDILHRDIKPSNIIITDTGAVKIMDFGIAKMKGATSHTKVGSVIGTLEYLAPELLSGQGPSPQSDLYAMGVVMYELLTGKLPFFGTTEAALINSILNHKPIPIKTLRPNLPKEAIEILDQLLQKKPEKRISSARELRGKLNSISVSKKESEASALLATINQKVSSISEKAQKLKFNKNIFSFEAIMVLTGAIVAIAVLFWGLSKNKSGKAIQESDQPDLVVSSEENILSDAFLEPISPGNDREIPARNSAAISDETISPVFPPSLRSPIKIPDNPDPKKPEPNKPDPKEPAPVETPKEKTKIPPQNNEKSEDLINKGKVETRNVHIDNLPVELALDENLSSDSGIEKGDNVRFIVLKDVKKDGLTVVAAGAPASGKVLKVKPSGKGKAFLEIQPTSVRAVNGQNVGLKSPSLGMSGSSGNPVIFTKGMKLNPSPRILNKPINIII